MPDAAQPARVPISSARPSVSPAEEANPAARAAFWTYKHVLSPLLHGFGFTECKYLPTCSEYAFVALARFGPWRGTWMALRRLARCHPWSSGGFDPVPDR